MHENTVNTVMGCYGLTRNRKHNSITILPCELPGGFKVGQRVIDLLHADNFYTGIQVTLHES